MKVNLPRRHDFFNCTAFALRAEKGDRRPPEGDRERTAGYEPGVPRNEGVGELRAEWAAGCGHCASWLMPT